MGVDLRPILDAVGSHAAASGRFEGVYGHEPKNAPGKGLTAAAWVDHIRPAGSGLKSTSALIVLNVRLYSSMIQEPQDAIDPELTDALSDLITAYSGDFTLGGLLRNVDLLGMSGIPLSARAAYMEQDHKVFRIYDITVPCIVNDAFEQAP